MKKQILFVFAALIMVALATSCQKVPQEQIDAAKAAIESVRAAQGDLYVPEEFGALQDSLSSAMAAIEVQKSKTFKNFDKVRTSLETIIQTAPTVIENVETAKEQVKLATEEEIESIKGLLEENNLLMAKAPKGKEGKAVLLEIKNEMDMIENSIAEITELIATGDYLKAQAQAKAAKESLMGIHNELSEAIAKVGGKK